MQHDINMENKQYVHLAIMAALSFVAMYFLMYAMVNSLANVYSSFNEVYMAGLMTAPMVLIELIVMRGMYKNTKLNAIIGAASIIAGVAFFLCIRTQAAVSDTQFLRSMIPHHAGAILMCENATVTDPQIKELCHTIIGGQQAEIDQMKKRLKELDAP
jgi:uncharacterized protein (DUF305 family)